MGKPSVQNGFFSWLGRQVGHVKKAVAEDQPAPPVVIYRKDKVEEQPMPEQPGVKLRRTTIDEVIVVRQAPALSPPRDERGGHSSNK